MKSREADRQEVYQCATATSKQRSRSPRSIPKYHDQNIMHPMRQEPESRRKRQNPKTSPAAAGPERRVGEARYGASPPGSGLGSKSGSPSTRRAARSAARTSLLSRDASCCLLSPLLPLTAAVRVFGEARCGRRPSPEAPQAPQAPCGGAVGGAAGPAGVLATGGADT